MIIATEKLIPGVLPSKKKTDGVDFLSILHGFDPSTFSEEAYETFAEKNPSIVSIYMDESDWKTGDNRLTLEERLYLAEAMLVNTEKINRVVFFGDDM